MFHVISLHIIIKFQFSLMATKNNIEIKISVKTFSASKYRRLAYRAGRVVGRDYQSK